MSGEGVALSLFLFTFTNKPATLPTNCRLGQNLLPKSFGCRSNFHNCFLFFRKSGKQHLYCTMCCLYSTITLFPKTEIQKPLSHGKKINFPLDENCRTCFAFYFPALTTWFLEQSGKITLCIAELFWEQEHVLRVTEHLSKRGHFNFGPFDWEPPLTRQGPHLTWLEDQTTFDQWWHCETKFMNGKFLTLPTFCQIRLTF